MKRQTLQRCLYIPGGGGRERGETVKLTDPRAERAAAAEGRVRATASDALPA